MAVLMRQILDENNKLLRTSALEQICHNSNTPVSHHNPKFLTAQAYPHDNLDLERWFRLPKSHERRIHGHHHAGIRIVREGATLIPTLDAHSRHPGVFTEDELIGFAIV